MADNKDYAACAEAWAEYSARHALSGDKWAVFGDGFDRGAEHARAEARAAATQSGGAWVPVNSGDKPAMGALVAVDVADMGVAIGIVKPHWRTADDLRIESDEGYTYELSQCSRFCVLPAKPKGDTDG